VAWLADHEAHLDDISLVINIDGAGYRGGRSAYSMYNLDDQLAGHIEASFAPTATLVPGPDFYQSDHAIFAMRGRPAMAITTELIDEMLDTLFHSDNDTAAHVDLGLLVDAADAIARVILTYPVAADGARPHRSPRAQRGPR
jgi:aminopeptidase YwaD